MLLTVGVIARNGVPHLARSLKSLPKLAGAAQRIEFVLVDSASTDGTLQAMLSFARDRSDTRVFAMRGHVNAAAARNVILEHARPGAVFLVDGDVEVERDFVVAALAELRADTCDVVYGRLPEILYDGAHRPIGRNADRYQVSKRTYGGVIRGVVMLGPNVVEARLRYDEAQRRSHDLELGIRLAAQFRILALPIDMGTHHTITYFNEARIGAFYRQAYLRPMGRLLRKHITNPRGLWSLRRLLSGHALGLLLQLALIGAILLQMRWMIGVVGLAIGLDVVRLARRRRLRDYLPHRLVAPWQIVYGFLWPENEALSYEVQTCPADRSLDQPSPA